MGTIPSFPFFKLTTCPSNIANIVNLFSSISVISPDHVVLKQTWKLWNSIHSNRFMETYCRLWNHKLYKNIVFSADNKTSKYEENRNNSFLVLKESAFEEDEP